MIETVKTISKSAGKEILAHYGQPLPVETKADNSPLTQADLASHHAIVDGLRDLDATIPIMSEESQEIPFDQRSQWEQYWVVDPMDGTKEFIKQTGEFTVNIALIQGTTPVLGVIYVPAQDLFFWSERGQGAFKQHGSDVSIAIKARYPDRDSLVIVASRDHAGPMVKDLLNRFPGADTHSMGSSLKFCMVAEGKADVYLRDVPTMEWDTAAAQCIVEEAGGVVHDLDGIPLRYNKQVLRNPSIITLGDAGLKWR